MRLSEEEISYIGTNTSVLHNDTNLRRIAESRISYFDNYNYIFEINGGYKRHILSSHNKIEKYVDFDRVEKGKNQDDVLPMYMCHEATFKFLKIGRAKEATNLLMQELGDYLYIQWNANELRIKTQDPRHLIEFDFCPRNNGPYINIITRV